MRRPHTTEADYFWFKFLVVCSLAALAVVDLLR